jgi:hypothetical protein
MELNASSNHVAQRKRVMLERDKCDEFADACRPAAAHY